MKRTTRYAIAGIGLALFGLAGCMGIVLSPFESSHNVQSVQYAIKAEPIEESVEPQHIYIEPQIVEQESEIEHQQDDDVYVSVNGYVSVYVDGYVNISVD